MNSKAILAIGAAVGIIYLITRSKEPEAGINASIGILVPGGTFEEGASYTPTIVVVNSSTRAAYPVEATFDIIAGVTLGAYSIPSQTWSAQAFTAGQSKSFDYVFRLPRLAANTNGQIWAKVNVGGTTIAISGKDIIANIGASIWGATVSIT